MSKDKKDIGLLWLVKRILKSYPLHVVVVLASIITVAVTTVVGLKLPKLLLHLMV